MNRDRLQLWLAVSCALATHAALFATGAAVKRYGWGGGGRPSELAEAYVSKAPALVVVQTHKPADIEPDPDQIGEKDKHGEAASSVDLPGQTSAEHIFPFEQAWTRQKPVPLPPRSVSAAQEKRDPSPEVEAAKPKEETSFGPMSVIGSTSLTKLSTPSPQAKSPNDPPLQPDPARQTKGTEEQGVADPQKGTATTPTPEQSPPQQSQPAAAGVASNAPPDPAEQGPSDLDAFAKEASANFTPGGMEARGGREVKLKRPRIDLGFLADATRLTGDVIEVRLMIETDETGHPRSVDVVGSSQSSVIDDSVRLALYDSWFGGKMPDRFPFTVRFYR